MIQNEAQLYQDGIQECRFLKSKILGAEQMKDACLPTATSINASDRQEELAILTEKQLELNNIQQKVEHLRSSLDCFCNIEGDISCDSVTRHAEEQLKTRNQCPFIHRQARGLVYDLVISTVCTFYLQPPPPSQLLD